jgi:Flp pilus assembly protein TadD
MRAILWLFLVVSAGCTGELPVRLPAGAAGGDPAQMRIDADTAYENEDWARAAGLLAQLTRRDAEDAESWFRLGNCEANLNEPARAIRAYGEALKRNPHSAKVWHNMGMVQLREAARTFMQMQKQTPPDDPLGQRAGEIMNGILDLVGRTSETSNDQ